MLPDMNESNVIFTDKLLNWIKTEGQSKYDESVSQYEHAVQTAMIAKENNSNQFQIIAALLHDIGHLLLHENQDKEDFLKFDLNHELIGSKWLEGKFPKEVTEPIKLHVSAKRFLCAKDKNYFDKLSITSKKSLKIQGGVMKTDEQEVFKGRLFYKEAILLRKWDDKAKIKGLEINSIFSFKDEIDFILKNENK